jgi:hypothetical protein
LAERALAFPTDTAAAASFATAMPATTLVFPSDAASTLTFDGLIGKIISFDEDL